MDIEQADIDALLAQAQQLAADVQDETPAPADAARGALVAEGSAPAAGANRTAPAVAAPACAAHVAGAPADSTLARVLRLRVPVIVQLAQRRMPIASIRDLSVGAIIEFDKAVEEPLDLLISNHRIGHGIAVRVGERFGLRIGGIATKADRIRSLGA